MALRVVPKHIALRYAGDACPVHIKVFAPNSAMTFSPAVVGFNLFYELAPGRTGRYRYAAVTLPSVYTLEEDETDPHCLPRVHCHADFHRFLKRHLDAGWSLVDVCVDPLATATREWRPGGVAYDGQGAWLGAVRWAWLVTVREAWMVTVRGAWLVTVKEAWMVTVRWAWLVQVRGAWLVTVRGAGLGQLDGRGL